MDTYYLVPENMIDNAHMKFIRDNAGVIESNGAVVFGRRETIKKIFTNFQLNK